MSELFHALGIQWSVLIAQMVNFAILIFVLSRFVYKPLLNVLDQRRDLVAESMKKADEISNRHGIIEEERTVILRKADEQAGVLLERAKAEAEALRVEIEKSANAQAAMIIAKGKEQVELERLRVAKEVQNKLAHAIVKSAEKILRREFSKEDQQSFESELKENIPALMA